MTETDYLSTAQVARLLGVSVATVKRWVDDGILPAYKTAGGHRRLLLGDVQRLAKHNQFPRLNRDVLGTLQGRDGPADLHQSCPRLVSALLAGDADEARALVHGPARQGVPLELVADQLVAPALTEVGWRWERGSLDVYQEHQATRLCESVLIELKAELEGQAARDRPLAIGGAPEHDPTVVPSLLIQLILLDNGWEAVNLGPHTPMGSFAKAIRDLRPRLLWLSMTHPPDNAEAFLAGYDRLSQAAEAQGVAVAVGGRALEPGLRSRLRYTTFGDGMLHFADFARQLHPQPRRPQRGRPAAG